MNQLSALRETQTTVQLRVCEQSEGASGEDIGAGSFA